MLPPPPYHNPFPTLVDALDTAIRTDLENVRLWHFVGLLVCTGAVFIGLICEVGEISHDVIGFFRERQIEWEYDATPVLLRKNREPSHKIKMWAAVGWLLIVLGVGGEGVFDGFISWADSTLQTFNTIVLRATQKEAGSAAESAKIAHEEAGAVKDLANEARADAKDALVRARSAQRSLAKAEQDAGKAQTAASNALATATDASNRATNAETLLGKAEAEANNAGSAASNALILAQNAHREADSFESELERLKKQAEDRVLNEYQQEQIRLKILPFLFTPYELESADTDEAENLLFEIDSALTSAGWIYKPSESKVFRFAGNMPDGRTFDFAHGGRGVEIGLTKALQQRFKIAADELVKALNSEGITAKVVTLPDNDPSPNNVHIMVLNKP
jgi:hypothetical protein